MGSDVKYCLTCGQEVEIIMMNETREDAHFIEVYKDGGIPCFGPYAYCPPPPPLTNEEWETIFERELEHVA
jgi:hypothetical protein